MKIKIKAMLLAAAIMMQSAPAATLLTVSNPNFINDHMGALTVSALQTNIDSAESYMRGELASYYALTNTSDKTAVATKMFARRAEDTDIGLLKARLNLIVLLQNIKNAPTAADKVTMFESNAAALGYSLYAVTRLTILSELTAETIPVTRNITNISATDFAASMSRRV